MKTLLALLLICLLPAAACAAQVTTPARGTALRAEILDAVRPRVEAEVGAPVEFVVQEMRVLGPWAFVYLHPQRPGGAPIDWSRTRYSEAWQEGMFDDGVSALLHRSGGTWLVDAYDLGATDVVWVPWADDYGAPAELFPGG